MKTLWKALQLEWYRQNYAYCMSNAYLAQERGEKAEAADWQVRAMDWQRDINMCGRNLYDTTPSIRN